MVRGLLNSKIQNMERRQPALGAWAAYGEREANDERGRLGVGKDAAWCKMMERSRRNAQRESAKRLA